MTVGELRNALALIPSVCDNQPVRLRVYCLIHDTAEGELVHVVLEQDGNPTLMLDA